jgi:hypothetical protein
MIDEDKALFSVSRPKDRLTITLSISTVFFLALLMLPLEFGACSGDSCPEGKVSRLIIDLVRPVVEAGSDSPDETATTSQSKVDEADLAEPTLADVHPEQQESMPPDSVEQLVTTAPNADWKTAAARVAEELGDEQFREEMLQESRWQKSHSVMFESGRRSALIEIDPILADFTFKRRVVGLGFSLGYCFIGFPIAGIPVENRAINITLFTCGKLTGSTAAYPLYTGESSSSFFYSILRHCFNTSLG